MSTANIAAPPIVHVPSIVIPQGNGAYLIKYGAPVVASEEIGTAEAAQLLGLSQRRVQDLCDNGTFRPGIDWRKPGTGPNAKYLIRRAAVLLRRNRCE